LKPKPPIRYVAYVYEMLSKVSDGTPLIINYLLSAQRARDRLLLE
jgi:hypothetical protein